MIREKPYNIVPIWVYIGLGIISLLICVFIMRPDYARAEQVYDIGKEFEGCSWSKIYEACFCYSDMRHDQRVLTWVPHEVCVRARQIGR